MQLKLNLMNIDALVVVWSCVDFTATSLMALRYSPYVADKLLGCF